MLSRVAENLFWMCRYLERADDVSRMLSVNHFLSMERSEDLTSQWAPLIETTGDAEHFQSIYKETNRENVLEYICINQDNSNSIYSCVSKGRENARAVREKLPNEIWEAINSAYYLVQNTDERTILADPLPFLDELRKSFERFHGTMHCCFSHTDSWHFCQLGIHLERAEKATRILDVKYFLLLPSVNDVGGAIDTLGWEAVLKSVSGLTMFRQQWKQVNAEHVLNFLLFDLHFPRSVLHCLSQADQIVQHLSDLATAADSRFPNVAAKRVGQMLARLRYTTVDDLFADGIHEFLIEQQSSLNQIGEAVFESFFNSIGVEMGVVGAAQ